MKNTLDIIVWFADEYFSRNHYIETMSGDRRNLNRCLRQCQYGQMQKRDGKPCTVSDKCGQADRYLHRE